MSDPVISVLKQLTPAGTLKDRDALMYEAGRASVPSAWGWKVLAAGLALTQTLTLALIVARPLASVPAPASMPAEPPPASSLPPIDGPWLLHWSEDPPIERVVDLAPDAPPLRAGLIAWMNENELFAPGEQP
jgi:hypothetical protein